MHAVNSNQEKAASLLLTEGKAQTEIPASGGDTALFFAANYGSVSMVELLLSAGADMCALNHKKLSAWDALPKTMYDFLASTTPKMKGRALIAAAKLFDLKLFKFLVATHADASINYIDEFGSSPIFYTVQKNRIETVSLLIDAKASLMIINKAKESVLTLHAKTLRDQKNEENEETGMSVITNLLLKREMKCPIDHQDAEGDTAMMIALQCGNEKLASLLLLQGANPRLRNKAGKKAIDLVDSNSLVAKAIHEMTKDDKSNEKEKDEDKNSEKEEKEKEKEEEETPKVQEPSPSTQSNATRARNNALSQDETRDITPPPVNPPSSTPTETQKTGKQKKCIVM